MKKGKILSCILASMLLVLGVSACGSKSGSDGGQSKKTTISYAIWSKNQEAGMNAIARAFEKKNPDIKVKVEVTPWAQYWTKLDAAATGKNLPDVFWMHSQEAYRYMSNGILMDLSDVMNKDLGKDNYPTSITKLYSLKNKVYAIPKDIDTVALWYNKTLFDQAGIKYPDSTWTWDTLLTNAKKLTNPDKGIYGLGAFNTSQSGYYNYVFQNNGKVLNSSGTKSEFNNKNTKAAIQFYTDLILKDKVSPSVQEYAENSEASFFESGHQAMGTFGSFYMNEFVQNDYVTKNCDVALLPKGKSRASVMNGLGNAVAANTPHKAAALKFVRFLGSKQGNILEAKKAGVIPAYTSVASNWVKAFPQFNSQVFVDSLKYGKVLPHSSNTVKAATLETEVLTRVFSGKETVNKGTEEIYTGVNKILE